VLSNNSLKNIAEGEFMNFKKSKPIITIALCFILIFSSITVFAITNNQNSDDITIILNGKTLNFDVNPYINSDNKTIVELRSISEALGSNISWNNDTKTIKISKDDTILELSIDKKDYAINGESMTMDTVPTIISGRTMVPVRFIAEVFEQTIQWDSSSNIVKILNDINYNYTIVTTGQKYSYDNAGNIINPTKGDADYGQDAQYSSTEFSFTNNRDDTVTDNNTGLTWQVIPSDDQMTWDEAVEYCENLELGGYDDWRLPSLKEAFSLSDFETGWPYIDISYFDFASETIGETSQINDSSQGQFWTSDYYLVGTTHNDAASAFGINYATGLIEADALGMGKYVRAVRGDEYGINGFVDNRDCTVSDEATGLMWMQNDSGLTMDWDDALDYAENFEYAGYDDWRLPDVKELQSIVDYSGSYPAIDLEYFNITELENNEFYYFWTSTSAYHSANDLRYGYAWYVAFGYAVDNEGNDMNGAGAVRFSPKSEDSSYTGEGVDNILNSVRLVRNIKD
jgi:hypothetical protein